MKNTKRSTRRATARRHANPAPTVTDNRPLAHPTLGQPSATWDYHDDQGALVCCVMRFDSADGDPAYRSLSTVDGDWVWAAPPAPRPPAAAAPPAPPSPPASEPAASLPPGTHRPHASFHNQLLLPNAPHRRVIDSVAAAAVATYLHQQLGWDQQAQTWMLWTGTHWARLAAPDAAEKLISDVVTEGCGAVGYGLPYLRNVTNLIARRHLLDTPQIPTGLVPFQNGLLDVNTQMLQPATPGFALDWCLPTAYDPNAECPTIKGWLRQAVADHDEETVQLLRAWLAALVRGMDVNYFLTLIGRGGTGKGTFQRLVAALVGLQNVAVTDLRRLETNRFETAKLYGARLCMVNEAGSYGGSVDVLKAITGGDHIALERKNQQQGGSFRFNGLVLMATNESIIVTDSTSGIERRRITVRFPYTASFQERMHWEALGGESAVLHAEIPGLIRWLLDMPVTEIRRRLDAPPATVVEENILSMTAGNSVAEWMLENCAPVENDQAGTQIGVKSSDSDTCFYANYLDWCDDVGLSRPVSIRKFSDTLIDIAQYLGHAINKGRHAASRACHLFGVRLCDINEEIHDWARIRKNGHALALAA